jgi:hypothetical protein
MTAIVAVATHDYVLLAADRRLTRVEKGKKPKIDNEEACKLVALCDTTVIAYTGRASILGTPTHEWVARGLAAANCCEMPHAVRLLKKACNKTFKHFPVDAARQLFVLAGWTKLPTDNDIRPYACAVSNMLAPDGSYLASPNPKFDYVLKLMPPKEQVWITSAGVKLEATRAAALERGILRLISREIGPQDAVRLIVNEIRHISGRDPNNSVGTKVLACCIPRSAVSLNRPGGVHYQARRANSETASFMYFDGHDYSPAVQYGPTAVCGNSIFSDVESTQTADTQSIQVRLLTPRPF